MNEENNGERVREREKRDGTESRERERKRVKKNITDAASVREAYNSRARRCLHRYLSRIIEAFTHVLHIVVKSQRLYIVMKAIISRCIPVNRLAANVFIWDGGETRAPARVFTDVR